MLNSSRVLKNTSLLYLRMGIVMLVSFYTVRITFEKLGIEDYGLYNVIAGSITLMSFLSNSLNISIQRFYSILLGKNRASLIPIVFSHAFWLFFCISIILLIISETLGLWFVNTYMKFPESKSLAVNYVYQFSILSFITQLMIIPYSSYVIAKEDVGFFAYVSMISTFLKLGVVFLLGVFPIDNLIFYAALYFLVTLITNMIYWLVCKKKYLELFFIRRIRYKVFYSISRFTGWTILGTISNVLFNQGNNILLNIYYGPIVNAAQGISVQVYGVLNTFSSNFSIATNPQLMKTYSAGEHDNMKKLFLFSSKIIAYMLFLIVIPLLLNMNFLMNLWLGNQVTNEIIVFTFWISILSIVFALQTPISAIIQATGNLKKYFIYVESITLLSLPISFIFINIGYPPQVTLIVSILCFSIAHIVRLIILKSILPFMYITEYCIKVFFRIAIVGSISYFMSSFIINNSQSSPIVNIIITFFLTFLVILVIGLSEKERIAIYNILKKKFFR